MIDKKIEYQNRVDDSYYQKKYDLIKDKEKDSTTNNHR